MLCIDQKVMLHLKYIYIYLKPSHEGICLSMLKHKNQLTSDNILNNS